MVEEAEVCREERAGASQATLDSLRTTIRAGWSSLHSCHQSPLSIHQPFSPWSSNRVPQRPHTSYSSFISEFFFTPNETAS